MTDDAIKLGIDSVSRMLKITKIKFNDDTISLIGKKVRDFYAMYPDLGELSDEEYDYICSQIEQNIVFVPMPGPTVSTEEIKNDHWLDEQGVTFTYTNRYLKYLAEYRSRSTDIIDVLKKDSYKIIQMLGDPNTDKARKRKGMLIGDVQSGKTQSYTTILNSAVDVGYQVIILLAGITENLRRQTQERMDSDLIGSTLDKNAKKPTWKSIGVGQVSALAKISPCTSSMCDFSKKAALTNPILIRDKYTIFFVTKKNAAILTQLKDSLVESNKSIATVDGKLNASILVVDDEADNASVNTSNPDTNPTSVNRAIREILNSFTRNSYLAVTATPFANIFIDDDANANGYGQDLFPSDFIHLIDRPKAYLGAMRLFGDEAEYKDHLIRIKNEEMAGKFPFRHKNIQTVFDFDELPRSMKDAIRYFIIVQHLMDYLPDTGKHRSMMINVTRYVAMQNGLADVIREWLEDKLKPQVNKYFKMPEYGDVPNAGEFYELKQVWDKFRLDELSKKKWSEFTLDWDESVRRIRIAQENMSKEAKLNGRLDYDKYKEEGDRVIAVGGQCLSRGITLENLVVTYFYRNSAAYDTLLQMGRWFGYRDAYMRYFEVWMAEDGIDWYSMIAEASEDLRLQITRMVESDQIPANYGLMVRRHPCSNLIITARNKMKATRAGKPQPIDLRGRVIESPRLTLSKPEEESNERLIVDLINHLEHRKNVPEKYVWDNVPRDLISGFVSRFKSHALSMGFEIKQLAPYISNNTDAYWDVTIVQSQGSKENSKLNSEIENVEKPIKLIERTCEVMTGKGDSLDYLAVSKRHVKIGSGPVADYILTDSDKEKLKEKYENKKPGTWDDVRQTSPAYLCQPNRKPLLLLYPIQAKIVDDDEKKRKTYFGDDTVIEKWGIGLGFSGVEPAKKNNQCFEYVLNPVAVRNEFDLGEDENDDIEEE